MLALGLAAALVGPPPPAAVPEPPVRWEAPPGCPDVGVVAHRIDDLLGRSVQPGEIELQGTITAISTGWSLQLQTQVGSVEDIRTLEANDCSVLADAAALVAVVMLDPVLAANTIEQRAAAAEKISKLERERPQTPPIVPELKDEKPKTKPKRRPRPQPRERPQRPPPRKRQPGEPPGVWLRVRGGGEFGAVPGGTGGFELAFAIGGDRVRGELAGAYWIGREAVTQSGRARIHLGTATPRVCGMIVAGPIDVPLCAGFELGAMRADANAVAGRTVNRIWLAAQAEPGIRWAFAERVSLWVAAQAFVPVVFPRFELTDPADPGSPEVVYAPSPAGLRGLVGLEFRLTGQERLRKPRE